MLVEANRTRQLNGDETKQTDLCTIKSKLLRKRYASKNVFDKHSTTLSYDSKTNGGRAYDPIWE